MREASNQRQSKQFTLRLCNILIKQDYQSSDNCKLFFSQTKIPHILKVNTTYHNIQMEKLTTLFTQTPTKYLFILRIQKPVILHIHKPVILQQSFQQQNKNIQEQKFSSDYHRVKINAKNV
eukprot:TRINITY_DN19816_c0_g1_i2.p5 TRINITY_DN19816_c0_g1~~TRINITY_DN19816_c0_g1_i2.p5  ORF type:complete len:121 (-),score=1.48 TRINITY_DN19816_c0_g1_i2:53-415(-)